MIALSLLPSYANYVSTRVHAGARSCEATVDMLPLELVVLHHRELRSLYSGRRPVDLSNLDKLLEFIITYFKLNVYKRVIYVCKLF